MRNPERLSFEQLDSLIRHKQGTKIDIRCPFCSAGRSTKEKRKRAVFRVWRECDDFLRFNCVHCGEKGWVSSDRGESINTDRLRDLQKKANERDEDERLEKIAKARFLWGLSAPIHGTPAERYLRETRSIRCPLPATLRYLQPSRPAHHPALIAAYGFPTEPEPGRLEITVADISAVQLTLLTLNGKKAKNAAGLSKISLGPSLGTPIVLAPPNDGLSLIICEGVEDALSMHEATGAGAWASTGAKKLAALAPAVPSYIETLCIIADDDKDGRAGAEALVAALTAHPCQISLQFLLHISRAAA